MHFLHLWTHVDDMWTTCGRHVPEHVGLAHPCTRAASDSWLSTGPIFLKSSGRPFPQENEKKVVIFIASLPNTAAISKKYSFTKTLMKVLPLRKENEKKIKKMRQRRLELRPSVWKTDILPLNYWRSEKLLKLRLYMLKKGGRLTW